MGKSIVVYNLKCFLMYHHVSGIVQLVMMLSYHDHMAILCGYSILFKDQGARIDPKNSLICLLDLE